MCYTLDCHTSGSGAFCFHKQRHCGQSEYSFWAKRPVLSDSRPAACVTTVADSTGRFAMTTRDGKPCGKCGSNDWDRWSHCRICSRENRRRYRAENIEKERQRARDWRAKNPEWGRNYARQYEKEHPDKKREWEHSRYEKNKGKRNEAGRKSYADNKDKYKANARRWRQNNPDKRMASEYKRRAKKKGNGGNFTAEEWQSLCTQYDYRCLCCGTNDAKMTPDHVIPLSKGGANDISNIQPLCLSCNASKQDKTIDYRTKPGLLRWIQRKLFD